MNRLRVSLSVTGIVALTVGLAAFPRHAVLGDALPPPVDLAEGPVIREHLDQHDIDAGRFSLEDLLQKGRALFVASFNSLDGAGRPEATGNGTPTMRARREFPDNFNRSSGPEANSCSGCHNLPRAGGGGDNVANVFVLAQLNDFTEDISPNTGDERNTLGMWGSGAIEMLAREMTADLQGLRHQALQQAATTGQPVTLPLLTKGISFGQITAKPDGSTDDSKIEGVDKDLIIKPFHQKGVVISVRQFTVNAYFSTSGPSILLPTIFRNASTRTFDFSMIVVLNSSKLFQPALPVSTTVVVPFGKACSSGNSQPE
jgi:hypothetical protein